LMMKCKQNQFLAEFRLISGEKSLNRSSCLAIHSFGT